MYWTGQTSRWETSDRGCGGEKPEVVPSFCYLGDCLSPGGGYKHTSITRCCIPWSKVNELLPILNSCSFPITSKGRVYNSCVRSAMLHASKTWAPNSSDLHRLQSNDWAMIKWMCSITAKDKVLRTWQLRWHGHVECSDGLLMKV